MKTLYAVVIALTALACGSVQPARVELGDRCLRCRRPVSDLKLAGEIIDSMRAPFPFRTAGCMAKYVKANSGTPFTAIFVTDFKSGKMIPASDAWFVPATIPVPGSMSTESDYHAFRSRGDAETARTQHEPLLRWAQVVADASAN
jgi:hypothetical protein